MRRCCIALLLLLASPAAQAASYWALGTGVGGNLGFVLARPQRAALDHPPSLRSIDGSVALPPVTLARYRLRQGDWDMLEFDLHALRALAAIALSKRLDLLLTARHLWQFAGDSRRSWLLGPRADAGLVSGGGLTAPILGVGADLAFEEDLRPPRQRARVLLAVGLRMGFLPQGAVPHLMLSLRVQGRSRLGQLDTESQP